MRLSADQLVVSGLLLTRFSDQVRCSRYHDSTGRAVLIGDAAHSNSSALGQGANSALQVGASFVEI
jgi:2-polyprenyl-6-methoxyphenol hydroxylase-like FAD-dependent oxidoreductase